MEKYTELHELVESAVIGLSQALDGKDMKSYTDKLDHYVREIAQTTVGNKAPDDYFILRRKNLLK